MMKTLIAGVAALSLTLTSVPVQAQNTDPAYQQDDFATALFGLMVLGIAATALSRDNDDRVTHQEPPVVRHTPQRIAPDRGGLRQGTGPRWHDRTRTHNAASRHPLPLGCLRVVDTRFGQHRMLGRACLRESYRAFSRLPARCEVRLVNGNTVRRGFDPQCLHVEGFRLRR